MWYVANKGKYTQTGICTVRQDVYCTSTPKVNYYNYRQQFAIAQCWILSYGVSLLIAMLRISRIMLILGDLHIKRNFQDIKMKEYVV